MKWIGRLIGWSIPLVFIALGCSGAGTSPISAFPASVRSRPISRSWSMISRFRSASKWRNANQFLVARIGDPDATLTAGSHVFQLSYTIRGVLDPVDLRKPHPTLGGGRGRRNSIVSSAIRRQRCSWSAWPSWRSADLRYHHLGPFAVLFLFICPGWRQQVGTRLTSAGRVS